MFLATLHSWYLGLSSNCSPYEFSFFCTTHYPSYDPDQLYTYYTSQLCSDGLQLSKCVTVGAATSLH